MAVPEPPSPPPPTPTHPSPPPPQPQPQTSTESTSIFRHFTNFDTTISLTIHNFTQPFLPRSFLKLLEISGDGRLFFPVLISLLLSPLTTASPLLFSLLINFLIGSLLDLLVIGLIKHLVRRPRPVYNKNMFLTFAVDHWSFPSGHASRVCFMASLFYLSSDLIPNVLLELKSGMLGSDEFESVKRLNLIVIVWATVTSVSRVLLGRHFVFDVVAGAGLGVLNASFVFHFLNYDPDYSSSSERHCHFLSSIGKILVGHRCYSSIALAVIKGTYQLRFTFLRLTLTSYFLEQKS